jgi:DNA modification methylase
MENEKEYKLTKELLDRMREIEGFPIGRDEDIIALSDPPYYTACPNPWIKEFIIEHGKPFDEENDDYHREPFAFDVSEGKNDPIYNAHSYHTKVPYKAIMRYILHYTEPGDIVFDGFCGTGMTGVAAQMCGNPDPDFKKKIEEEMPYVKWGTRKAILNDLCPSATFIAYNYNKSVNIKEFRNEAKRILAEVENECGWMYDTNHLINDRKQYEEDLHGNKKFMKGRINYIVWSDVFICPNCFKEIIFYEYAVNKEKMKLKKEFKCPNCDKKVAKNPSGKSDILKLERTWETFYDAFLGQTVKHAKQVPVLIEYTIESVKNKTKQKIRYKKIPDDEDFIIMKKIENSKIPYWHPTNKVPKGYNTEQPKISHGVSHAHHFYTKRNLWVLSAIYDRIKKSKNRNELQIVFQSICGTLCSKITRYNLGHRGNGPISGTLYIASLTAEANVLKLFLSKVSSFLRAFKLLHDKNLISCQSSTSLQYFPSDSLDYIFIDPPFGGNLMYSELNFLWETWLGVFTNNRREAIINNIQKKDLKEYKNLIEHCFIEYYRILKPGRWITIEFHNSRNSVWMAIQEALQRVGFVVADVSTLDKKQGTFKQITSTSAVKQDLIITAYKPNGGLEERFKLTAGTEEGVWEFVREHLKHLPPFVEKDGNLEIITERQNFLLFDRMVAFHVQRGVIVPISAGDFYVGLRQRFPERDGMYFLPDQVVEYDRKRLTANKVEQLSLTVHDEKSAVQWLRQELIENHQTFQEIQPKFLQNLHKDKYEKLPELSEVLEQNFLKNEEGKWYNPDPNKQSDLEKIRERALLREFEKYKEEKGRLKEFRTEAVRAGFKKCWSERDYKTILEIGKRLPPAILQEESTLLMYYDNAMTRGGDV